MPSIIINGFSVFALVLAFFETVAFSQEPQKRISTTSSAESFSSLYGQFFRTFAQGQNGDSTRGEFYFWSSQKMLIEVTQPIHQIMMIEGNSIWIYYPEDQRAFHLESANPVILPLVTGLKSVIRPDYGLAEMGFQLTHQEMRSDTTFSFWTHGQAPKKIGQFKIAERNDRLVYTQYDAPGKQTGNKSVFENYATVNGIAFPQTITSTTYSPHEIASESIHLSHLKVNFEIPPRIANFSIPAEVAIEKRKW